MALDNSRGIKRCWFSERQLLVNNIDIATLNGAQSHYTLDTGKHQTYSVTLFAADTTGNQ
ncbi:hypothetical protein [Rheinheimera aquimaris]|uniref:hypothetical protein n=1 Tax=Rheinheimera aquimaris TaxID=412437 RepID=UPI003A981A46